MSEGFLSALQDCFLDLLAPDDEFCVQLESLVDEFLSWLSGGVCQIDLWLEKVAVSLEDLRPCPEKQMLEGALPLVLQVVEANAIGHGWQLLAVLRQTLGSLKRGMALAA